MEQAQAGALLRPMRPESLMRGRSALGAGEAQTAEKAEGAGVQQTEAQRANPPAAMHRLAGLAPFASRTAERAGTAAQESGWSVAAPEKRLPMENASVQEQAPAQSHASAQPPLQVQPVPAAQDNASVQEQAPAQSQFPAHAHPFSPTSVSAESSLPTFSLPDAPVPVPTYCAALIPVEADGQTPAEPLFPETPAPDSSAMPDPLAGLELLAPDLLDEPEDDWPDENEQDAIPTAQMPLPACVPLYDLSDSPHARRKWPWAVGGIGAALALGGALAWYLWQHPMRP